MDKRPDIGNKVEKALESLDGIKRAEPQPFFYTRLIGRLQKDQRNIWELAGSFLARPAVAVVGLCLILLFNIGILVQKEMSVSNTSTSFSDQLTADDENIFAANTTYDYENLDQE
jgi:hypothetical protein